mgnify:FL=1
MTSKPAYVRLLRFFDKHLNVIFILPAVLLLVGLVIYPLFFNIQLSLHDVDILNFRRGNWDMVGFQNYISVLMDPFMQDAFVRTLKFLVLSVVGQVVLGLIGAFALNADYPGKKLLMPFVLIPMMITPVAVGLFWRMLLNSQWGIVNYVLSLFGVLPQHWLADPKLAFTSVAVVQIWWGVSFVILILLGGLSSLPAEPFEAARIDGASRVQIFRFITLPLLKPVLMIVIMLRSIDAFREFDIIYSLTQGGPGDATRVFSLELYLTTFERGQIGIAAAQALLLALITMLLATGLIRYLNQKD